MNIRLKLFVFHFEFSLEKIEKLTPYSRLLGTTATTLQNYATFNFRALDTAESRYECSNPGNSRQRDPFPVNCTIFLSRETARETIFFTDCGLVLTFPPVSSRSTSAGPYISFSVPFAGKLIAATRGRLDSFYRKQKRTRVTDESE